MSINVNDWVYSRSSRERGVVKNKRVTTGAAVEFFEVLFPSGLRMVPEADLISIPSPSRKIASGDFDPPSELART